PSRAAPGRNRGRGGRSPVGENPRTGRARQLSLKRKPLTAEAAKVSRRSQRSASQRPLRDLPVLGGKAFSFRIASAAPAQRTRLDRIVERARLGASAAVFLL